MGALLRLAAHGRCAWDVREARPGAARSGGGGDRGCCGGLPPAPPEALGKRHLQGDPSGRDLGGRQQ
eukprot:10041523-Prorocentrum_lima.AAC.1